MYDEDNFLNYLFIIFRLTLQNVLGYNQQYKSLQEQK
jgi:hypothetical protein